ncbi:MAG: phosphoribosyltransferase family protein [Bacteroidales bacterium]|nr:phosphoribosyltransferase family protein [Bacteroidales bacterium]
MNWFKSIVSDVMDLAWPNLCHICEQPLVQGEQHLCMNCLYELPKANFKSFRMNLSADRFYGKVLFEKSAAGYLYQKESNIQTALELLKYKGEKELGECLAKFAGARLFSAGFFEDIDLIIPVPLHKDKAKKRGYNQSEWIAKGLSQISQIPYDAGHLLRTIKNPTQTTKTIWERWENAQGLFELRNADSIAGKHLLLVDDVLTSGSTLCACGQTILKAPQAKISFFALALA